MAAEPAQVASESTSRVKPRAVARIAEIRTSTPTPTSNAVNMNPGPPERTVAPFSRLFGQSQAAHCLRRADVHGKHAGCHASWFDRLTMRPLIGRDLPE